MRILHVGWGFSPWRPGGLITYAEDLMSAQVSAGHEVAYFFSGRHYPVMRTPRLRRWRRARVEMFEIVNSPIVVAIETGTREPERDLDEPRSEAIFARCLKEVRPDVIHVQELLGLPSSIVEIASEAGVPIVMTLQDYQPLCTTMRLFDRDDRICLRREIGEDCVARNAAAPADARELVARTTHLELTRLQRSLPLVRSVKLGPLVPHVHRLIWRQAAWALARGRGQSGPFVELPKAVPPNPPLAAAFQRRRDTNVARLSRADRLVTSSRRTAEIYTTLGVDGERIDTVPFTLAHIERLRPRILDRPPAPVTFATLNGCASGSKGALLVRDAVRILDAAGAPFRLLVYGFVDPRVHDELDRHPAVELRGGYDRSMLDELLDPVDVGLMPSIWEEALGFTGLELLAKGIPVIANALGGMVEYTRPGETGWLNRTASARGLAEIMGEVIADPRQVVSLHRRIVEHRAELIEPMAGHAARMEAIYDDAIAARALTPRS
ncbi:MAG: hypothetical protein NVSMB25_03030 [Thermoleophilaceae bacterium]